MRCAVPGQSCLCLEVVRSSCSKETVSVLGRSKTDVLPDQWACMWNCSLGLGFPGCARARARAHVHFQISALTRVTPGSGEARRFFLLLH